MGAVTTIDNRVLGDLVGLVERDPACEDRPGLRELTAGERRVRAWLDAYAVKIARRTRELAEQDHPAAPPSSNAVIASLLDSGCPSGKVNRPVHSNPNKTNDNDPDHHDHHH